MTREQIVGSMRELADLMGRFVHDDNELANLTNRMDRRLEQLTEHLVVPAVEEGTR